MVIWAIELVKVLELAASVFPEAEDSVRGRDHNDFLRHAISSSKSAICFRDKVNSPVSWATLSLLDWSSLCALSSRAPTSCTCSCNRSLS